MHTRMGLHNNFGIDAVFLAEHLEDRGHIIEEGMAVSHKQHAEFFHVVLHLGFDEFAGDGWPLLQLSFIIQSERHGLQDKSGRLS